MLSGDKVWCFLIIEGNLIKKYQHSEVLELWSAQLAQKNIFVSKVDHKVGFDYFLMVVEMI